MGPIVEHINSSVKRLRLSITYNDGLDRTLKSYETFYSHFSAYGLYERSKSVGGLEHSHQVAVRIMANASRAVSADEEVQLPQVRLNWESNLDEPEMVRG